MDELIIKKFVFDLRLINSAKELMATAGQFSKFANETNKKLFEIGDIKDDALERYDMDYFHSDRFSDYIFDICYPSRITSADLPIKTDPDKVIFEFKKHEKLSQILSEVELGYLKEILDEYKVEIVFS